MTHPNSIAANRTVDRAGREAAILAVLGAGTMTDREIAGALGFGDLNAVRPRITEMVEDGRLIEWGERRCAVTGRSVRVVGAGNLFQGAKL